MKRQKLILMDMLMLNLLYSFILKKEPILMKFNLLTIRKLMILVELIQL